MTADALAGLRRENATAAKIGNVRVVIWRETYQGVTAWIVQGVDLDVGAQGRTRKEAEDRFVHATLHERFLAGSMGIDVPKAPRSYLRMYRALADAAERAPGAGGA